MPIYEFVCGECGFEFEKILSFSATATPVCVHCGASNVARQMGRPAIHFKGSGWYINDSKKSSKKSESNSAASGTKDDNGTEGAKVESTESGNSGESSDSKATDSKSGDSKTGDSPAVEKDSTKSTAKTKASSPTKSETA